MKINKKGFTLIELLAVIVILAIIALIATPIILNIINDSREKTNQRSVEAFGKAIEETVSIIMADENYNGGDIVCSQNLDDLSQYAENAHTGDQFCVVESDSDEIKKATIKKINYSGNRVKCDNVEINKNTGSIFVSGCNVGSSSKKYQHENIEVVNSGSGQVSDMGGSTSNSQGETIIQGSSVDALNYVYFNCSNDTDNTTCEKWRVVGVFDGRMKIVRSSSIGNMSWQTEANNKINDWSQSSLQQYLNGDYYNSLSNSAKNMIAKSVWYLGGAPDANGNADYMYNYERGTLTYKDTYPTTFRANVGLLYPSDYGNMLGKECTDNLSAISSTACKKAQWLPSTGDIWLITSDTDDYKVYYIRSGKVALAQPKQSYQVYPTVYLKSDVKLTGGLGSDDSPYELSL